MHTIPDLFIGTSGWRYRWQGLLYPPELQSADYLSYYATRFNTTEINNSFYHFTMRKTTEQWLAATPAHFRFAAKLHREITHTRQLVHIEEPLEKMMASYPAMGPRLGPILVQLAASLHFDPFVAEDFFKTLRDRHPRQPFALEARHRSWFTQPVFDLLGHYRISWVIASAGRRFPGMETATSDLVYLRLHGEEKLYVSAYSDRQLERYAFMVHDWLMDGKQVWVFFNNTILGHAVGDALKLEGLLEKL